MMSFTLEVPKIIFCVFLVPLKRPLTAAAAVAVAPKSAPSAITAPSLPPSLLPPFQTGGRHRGGDLILAYGAEGRTDDEGGRPAGPRVSVMSYEIPSFLRRRRSSVRSRWAMPWVASAFWHFGAPENGSHALTHGSATFTYKRENFPLKI